MQNHRLRCAFIILKFVIQTATQSPHAVDWSYISQIIASEINENYKTHTTRDDELRVLKTRRRLGSLRTREEGGEDRFMKL